MINAPTFKQEYKKAIDYLSDITMDQDCLIESIRTHYCINCGKTVEMQIYGTDIQYFGYRKIEVENQGIYYYCEEPECAEQYQVLYKLNKL